MTTLSELDSRAFIGLGDAADYVDLNVWHNATVQRVNVRTMQTRSSTVDVLLGTTDEFTVTDLDHDITDLVGKGVPCFVERRSVDQGTYTRWRNIRIVPLNQFNDYQILGTLACSFYGDETSDNEAQATQYLKFTFRPGGVCRIRFDRDGQRTALDAATLLPDNLSDLIVREVQNDVIPRIKLAMQMDLRRDPDGRTDIQGVLMALNEIYLQNERVIKELDAQWRIWAFSDRSKEDGFNLPTPSSQNLYPGGRGSIVGWGGNNN